MFYNFDGRAKRAREKKTDNFDEFTISTFSISGKSNNFDDVTISTFLHPQRRYNFNVFSISTFQFPGEIEELCIISCITIHVFCFTQRHCTNIDGDWIVKWYFSATQVFLRIMYHFLYYNPILCFTQRHCTVCHLVGKISEPVTISTIFNEIRQFQREFLAISTDIFSNFNEIMPTRLQFQRFAIRDINTISTVWQFRCFGKLYFITISTF